MNAKFCLLLNFASTWSMVGLIWLIQVVAATVFVTFDELGTGLVRLRVRNKTDTGQPT